MKKLLLAALVLCATLALGQTYEKDDIVLDSGGHPIPNASVYVCGPGSSGSPCSPAVAIYSDYAMTHEITQPLITDPGGNYQFYTASPLVDIQIIARGIPRLTQYVALSGNTEVFSVTAHGAACDNGVTDDSTAIQNTINAAETVLDGNSTAKVTFPPGRQCAFGTSLVLLANAVNSIFLSGGVEGPLSWLSGAQLVYTGSGDAFQVAPSVESTGLAVGFTGFRLDCGFPSGTNTCTSLINLGQHVFGPVYIDHVMLNGNHNATSGPGSYGAAVGIFSQYRTGLQIRIKDNLIQNFSSIGMHLQGGTDIVVEDNQMFDMPVGIQATATAPLTIHKNYFELMTHAIELTNEKFWTLPQVDIANNQFALLHIPPYFNQTDTGAQRAVYITNQVFVDTMSLKVNFHDNQVNLSEGYQAGSQGLAPYAVETNLTCGAYCFTLLFDSHDNYYAGITTSAIHSNNGISVITSHNDLVTTDFQPYESGSNLPAIDGTYSGGVGFYEPNGIVQTAYGIFTTNVTAPRVIAGDGTGTHPSVQMHYADTTHLAILSFYDHSGIEQFGIGGNLDNAGMLNMYGQSGNVFNFNNGIDMNGSVLVDTSGNVFAGVGSNVVYRCTTAGTTLPIGSLTTNAAACGVTADSGLRVK